MAIGCNGQPTGTFDDNCYVSAGACVCSIDGGTVAGAFDSTGTCLPVPTPSGPPPACSADPNPACAPQSVTNTLTLDGGAPSSLVIGDYNIVLQNTYQSGTTYGAYISLNDFCGNNLGTDAVTIGSPATYSEYFGNINITASLSQVATGASQWAQITATMTCPFYVQTDGGFSPPVCGNTSPASRGGNIYSGSVVDIGGYGFTYTGNAGGYANFLVTCAGATLDSLQCIVGQQVTVPRPMDNGGRTINVTASSAYLQYADVQINVQ